MWANRLFTSEEIMIWTNNVAWSMTFSFRNVLELTASMAMLNIVADDNNTMKEATDKNDTIEFRLPWFCMFHCSCERIMNDMKRHFLGKCNIYVYIHCRRLQRLYVFVYNSRSFWCFFFVVAHLIYFSSHSLSAVSIFQQLNAMRWDAAFLPTNCAACNTTCRQCSIPAAKTLRAKW